MDSSICLALAAKEFGPQNVLSLGFRYQQRHIVELQAAECIAQSFGVPRKVMNFDPLPGWELSSLVNVGLDICHDKKTPNSFVPGRNGLFLLMTAPLVASIGAETVYMGVMEVEGHYPDCSRHYVDLVQKVMQIDLQRPSFTIRTPLVGMTKFQTLELASSLGILELLLDKSISCYEGLPRFGCRRCPACNLRNAAVERFSREHPEAFPPSYADMLLQ